ncbi:hypothetical protein Hamer_G002357 [Homarus americanus]|uniref:Uncharacterized protein n=1 Tax=Homarus americanus TaxID=6706 RepID=A0A8J5K619_HOMAM|nr:hypothetical protein Hamer_G002357 [Homarus americanus]
MHGGGGQPAVSSEVLYVLQQRDYYLQRVVIMTGVLFGDESRLLDPQDHGHAGIVRWNMVSIFLGRPMS